MYFKDMKNASKKRIAALENEDKSLQLLLKEGRISKLDLLRLQAHLSQATHDHIILDQSEKNSLSLLGTLAGSRAPITDLEPLPFGTTFVVFDTVDEREVLECSHVVRKFSLLSEASQSKFKAALSETKPKVSIFGRAIGSAGGSDFELYDDWQTGLRVMFRLWDGSVTKNKVKKSVLDIEMTKLELEEIQNQTLDKARKAEGALREASSKIKVALRQRKEAEESLRIEKLRYEAGENTINDLLSIESELWDAEANLNRSYYEKIITEASILSIFGRLTPERMRYPLNGNVNEKMSEKDEVVW